MPIPGLPAVGDDQLFQLCNLVLPAWLLLLTAPKWRPTSIVVTTTALGFSLL